MAKQEISTPLVSLEVFPSIKGSTSELLFIPSPFSRCLLGKGVSSRVVGGKDVTRS